MKIFLSSSYVATVQGELLGYVGENNSRKIQLYGYETEGASRYELIFSYFDEAQYEVDITSGEYTIPASVLREPGTVDIQVVALTPSGEFIKKSNIVKGVIEESVNGESQPIPPYEDVEDMYEQILESAENAVEASRVAQESAQAADISKTEAEAARDSAVAKSQEIAGSAAQIEKNVEDISQLSESITELNVGITQIRKTVRTWNFIITPTDTFELNDYTGFALELGKAKENGSYVVVFDKHYNESAPVRNLVSTGWKDFSSNCDKNLFYCIIDTTSAGSIRFNANTSYTGNIYFFDVSNDSETKDSLIQAGINAVNKTISGGVLDVNRLNCITTSTKYYGDVKIYTESAVENTNFYKHQSIALDLSAYSEKALRLYIVADKNIAPKGFRILTSNGKSPTTDNQKRYLANKEYIIDSLFSEFADATKTQPFGLFATADEIKESGDVALCIYYDYSNSESYKVNNFGKWFGKKIVFYGDSITALGGYVDYVQSKTGCVAVNMGIGGTLIQYINENSFSSDSRIGTIPQDADAVIIMGGTNDWEWTKIETELVYDNGFDRTNFRGALAYTIKAIQDRCPNAMIVVATNIGGRGSVAGEIQPLPIVAPSNRGGNGAGNTPLSIRNAEIEVANMLNVPVCDTWSCGINGFNRPMYIADTVHPNADGFNLVGAYVVGFLESHPPIN